MKSGARALGIAESYDASPSSVAAAVVRADRTVEDLALDRWTVGGTDATDTAIDLIQGLDRPDAQYVLLAGIAPAWYNVLDLQAIHAAVDRPVLSVSFEGSDGLADAIREAFDDEATVASRLETYRAQPAREPVALEGTTCYVRAVGLDEEDPADVVRAFTPEGGRPEPLRVARLAARAADDFADRLAE